MTAQLHFFAPARQAGTKGWTPHLAALGMLAVAILLIFARDAGGMASIWWNASTFNHCLLIPFVIAWLVEQRLAGLRQIEPAAWTPGLLAVTAGNLLWLAGQAAGVAIFRHAGLVIMLEGAVLATLGPSVVRAILFPMAYALFLIPFGDGLVPPLQTLTAKLAMAMLGLAGVPAHIEGVFITIPNGYFEVAEACSGAKFVIAMTAYAALVCNLCFTRWSRRIGFFIFAIVTSILANGVRAFATILVAHWTSVEAAVGFDHVLYGWVFFGIVMVLVMAAGWRFFDRSPLDPWFDPHALQGKVGRDRLIAATIGTLLIACAAPAWSMASSIGAEPIPTQTILPGFAGWSAAPSATISWSPHFAGADRIVQRRYRDKAGDEVDLAIALYGEQQEGHELVGFGQGAAGPHGKWAWSANARAPADALGEQITGPGPTIRHVVSFYVVGGTVTGSAATVKLETLKLRLLGGDPRAAAILVSAEQQDGRPADATIGRFLKAMGNPKDLADRMTGRYASAPAKAGAQ